MTTTDDDAATMGFTSFAIRVQNPKDLEYWVDVINKHNTCEDQDQVGEALYISSVLRWKSKSKAARPRVPSGLYLIACNSGGRGCTYAFLMNNMRSREDIILGMDDKPSGWYDVDDFAWRAKDDGTLLPPDTIFDGPL